MRKHLQNNKAATAEEKKVARDIGACVLQWRKAYRWSQKVLAEKARINHSNISHIENGQFHVLYYTLCRIAKAFDIKPEHLLYGKPKDKASTEETP